MIWLLSSPATNCLLKHISPAALNDSMLRVETTADISSIKADRQMKLIYMMEYNPPIIKGWCSPSCYLQKIWKLLPVSRD